MPNLKGALPILLGNVDRGEPFMIIVIVLWIDVEEKNLWICLLIISSEYFSTVNHRGFFFVSYQADIRLTQYVHTAKGDLQNLRPDS